MMKSLRAFFPVLLLFASLNHFTPASADGRILGTAELDLSQSTCCENPRVQVYSKHGDLIEAAPISANGTFELFSLSSQPDGRYALHLVGSMVHEYHPLLVLLQEGAVAGVIVRSNPMMVPPQPNAGVWKSNSELFFKPFKATNYQRKRSSWTLNDLWKYKYHLLQFGIVVFVVQFPRFIRDLPKDMREELMGEKEPDIGDPNALVKTLTGRPAAVAHPPHTQT